jgi:hypothetical protein
VVAIAVTVTVLWAANVIVGFFDPSRAVPGLNVIFGIIVGSAFTLGSTAAKRLARLINPPNDDASATDEGGQP